ncbi:MAG: hypothetical protein WCG27_02440 [Pseudomonadota bacterium]
MTKSTFSKILATLIIAGSYSAITSAATTRLSLTGIPIFNTIMAQAIKTCDQNLNTYTDYATIKNQVKILTNKYYALDDRYYVLEWERYYGVCGYHPLKAMCVRSPGWDKYVKMVEKYQTCMANHAKNPPRMSQQQAQVLAQVQNAQKNLGLVRATLKPACYNQVFTTNQIISNYEQNKNQLMEWQNAGLCKQSNVCTSLAKSVVQYENYIAGF